MQTLQSRTGQNLSGSASQRFQDIQHGGGVNANDLRNSAESVNRDSVSRRGDGNSERLERSAAWTSQRLCRRQAGSAVRRATTRAAGGFGGGGLGGGGGFDSGRLRRWRWRVGWGR